MYKYFFKRVFDIVLSTILIVVFSPILLLISVLSRIIIGKNIIFKQTRIGKSNKEFTIYKFRTMKNIVNNQGILLPDIDRMTSFGSFLRSTSLDELPELFNILFGTMSFVGPRPLLVEYLPLYSESQIARHTVSPGLTGLAQINGRNTISWGEKFAYDIEYINNISFLGDLKIIVMTAVKVIKRDGISSEGNATTEKFNGTN